MTNNLLPFDPKLAKNGDTVFYGAMELIYIAMDGFNAICRSPALHDYSPVNPSNLRLRPRMVKRVIDVWNDRVWTISGHRRENPSGGEIYVIKTIEIEVPE